MAHGEFVAIMGASGSGKSSLLHLLGCLTVQVQGGIDLTERQWNTERCTVVKAPEQTIGFVFQAFNLIPQHSILENVELPLIYGGMGRKIRVRSGILHQVGLGTKVYHRPTELSGGEVQRASIARALAVEPLLLLADEPTGNLDSHTGEGIMKLFVDLNRQGTTILLVTHNSDIADYSNRLIEMRDGRIIRDSRGLPVIAPSV